MTLTLAELSESLFASLNLAGAIDHMKLATSVENRICLLLIDGFGRNAYEEYASFIPNLRELNYRQTMAATFPSTTATSLTSLGTGLTAGQHGMVGYTMRIPYSGPPERILNALRWDERVDPEIWQPNPTIFQRATSHGLRVSQVANKRYADTGFTRASLRGANYLAASSISEMVEQGKVALSGSGSFAYLYLNDVDEASHSAGYGSERFKAALSKVDSLIAQLIRELPRGTQLYVTSDHGMINRGDYVVIGKDNQLNLDVDLLAGEPRVRYLHVSEGKQASVMSRWQEYLGDRASVLTRDQAISRGLFGDEIATRTQDRIGDLVVIANGNFILVEMARESQQLAMVGHHGGITAEETEIPLLVREI